MTFGERLKESRLKKGLTQEQLAKIIGVAKSTLTGYEKGNREPDFFKIQKLTKALDVNADFLLGTESTTNSLICTGKISDQEIKSKKNINEAMKILDSLTPELQEYAIKQIKELLNAQDKMLKSKESE